VGGVGVTACVTNSAPKSRIANKMILFITFLFG